MHPDLAKYVNTIMLGDCRVNLARLPAKSIDLIFADPPYWMQTAGILLRTNGAKFAGVDDAWDKFGTYEEYDEFSEKWLRECRRILKPDGAIWVIGAFQNIYRLGFIMQNLGFWILNDIVWSKPNAAPNFSGTRYQNSHETLLWCCQNQKSKYTFNYRTMKHLHGGTQDKSVWDIGICIGGERLKDRRGKKIHSAQKPEKLLYKIILSTTKPGDIVLDPFFGSGTTGAVAKQLGRNYVGCEREPKYLEIAKQRLEKINFEDTDLHRLALETKPPRVSVFRLLAENYLTAGEKFYDRSGNEIGELTANGSVNDGEQILSIHRLAAKCRNLPNSNGWTFFYITRDAALKPLNDLRYEYNNGNGNAPCVTIKNFAK